MSGGGFDHKRGNRHENRHQDSHNSCVVVNDNLGGRRVSLGWDVSIPEDIKISPCDMTKINALVHPKMTMLRRFMGILVKKKKKLVRQCYFHLKALGQPKPFDVVEYA